MAFILFLAIYNAYFCNQPLISDNLSMHFYDKYEYKYDYKYYNSDLMFIDFMTFHHILRPIDHLLFYIQTVYGRPMCIIKF